ncbi:helix-turn-helix domain-containing protein [Panacibacter ginsenosidivorans]|nr:AraC family transcriptional regulator [Panacibacter ginsenosidivorans]
MNFGFTDILSIIIIFQLLFLAVFLFSYTKGKRLSNILLASFFLAICFNFTDGILILRNAYFDHPSFAFIGNNFSLLFGPLLYLYTRSVIYKNFRLKARDVLHAAPFFVFVVFAIISYHTQSSDMKRFILSSAVKQEMPAVLYIVGILLYIQFFSYAFFSLLQIRNYRKAISNHFSAVNKINLDWLYSTVVLFMIVIGIGLLNSFITLTPLMHYFNVTLTLIIIAIFLFINRVLFKALQQPTIFDGIIEGETEIIKEKENVEPEKPASRYAGSTLSDIEKENIKMLLINYMQQQQPYLEPQLTLEELADMLKIKPRILSQVINECLNQNFFDFINRYRIEEAKRLLSNPDDKKITVLEVLYKVGFNSKSSFNTLFKKYTGLTPSEFKKTNTTV